MVNFGLLAAEIISFVWAPQQISTDFASWLPYCRDGAHWRPTKLCTMFGRFPRCYAVYTFSEDPAPWRNFATCKIYFTSKSCVLLHWQRYCTALQQRASAILCGVVQWVFLIFNICSFYGASLCKRCTSYGNSVCLSVCPSVRPSVCPSQAGRLLCQKDGT